MIRISRITLDGKYNGFCVGYKNENNSISFLRHKRDMDVPVSIRLFKNLEVAKLTAKTIIGKADYIYYLYINGKKYNLNRVQKVNDSWQVYDNNTLYIVYDVYNFKVVDMRYLVFENGDTVRCDKKYGYKRQYELLQYVSETAKNLICQNNKSTIYKIDRYEDEIILHISDSTARIHITLNSRIMDINQCRKEENNKTLPFIKDMDKFTTLYMYTTVDYEPKQSETNTHINNIINWLLEDIITLSKSRDGESEKYSEPKYVTVDNTKTIIVEEV